ncbi:MAG: hypothetical protein LBD99_02130, partial [Candidatus Margulisbacteria bacterium]|nr:hypothetical protein [Candidatus Margulisiibacteriota bacterium]
MREEVPADDKSRVRHSVCSRWKIIFGLLFLLCAGAYATTAAAFLDNGIGARSEGLARAYAAVAADL